MKDVVLVAPILIAGGTFLISLADSSHHHRPYYVQELVFLAFLLGLLYAWHRGQRLAAERLRALELGWVPAEGFEPPRPERTLIATGAWTPVVLLGLASMAATTRPDLSPGIWVATILLGMTTLICGTILILTMTLRNSWTASRQGSRAPHRAGFKPMTDPDEFDVVGQRGSNGYSPEERA